VDLSNTSFWIVFWGVIGAGMALVWRWQGSRAKARERVEREQRDQAEAEFRKSAKLMRARVRWSYQMGMVNLKPNLHFHLTVEAPEGAYDAEVEQPIEYMDLPRFADGSMVGVWVDPKNRERVVLCDPATADEIMDTGKRLSD
jgi:hypothetical protein